MLERLLCYEEVAQLLGVSVQRLREWNIQGASSWDSPVRAGASGFRISSIMELITKGVPPFHAH